MLGSDFREKDLFVCYGRDASTVMFFFFDGLKHPKFRLELSHAVVVPSTAST